MEARSAPGRTGHRGGRHQHLHLLLGGAAFPGPQVEIAAACRVEQRGEHRKADDVIHMGVGEQHGEMGLRERLRQPIPQEARAGVQNDRFILGLIQHAAGFPAKDGAGCAVHGHGSPRAQQPDADAVHMHQSPFKPSSQLEETLVRFSRSMRLRAMRLTARESSAPVMQETAQAVQLGKRR